MEIWKEIEGYEGLYKISNYGRVKNIKTGRILKSHLNPDGYPIIGLFKDGKQQNIFMHRLVAIAFVENPNNFPFVNHKDENKRNYNIDNLEFCTCKYNLNYGNAQERKVEKSLVPVVQKTKSGEVIKIHKSMNQAERDTGVPHNNISICVSGKLKTAGGYIWENIND
jgi:hypothetical protein